MCNQPRYAEGRAAKPDTESYYYHIMIPGMENILEIGYKTEAAYDRVNTKSNEWHTTSIGWHIIPNL